MDWSVFKQSFDRWEDHTAKYLEHWLKSPLVLGPSASMLTAIMKAKSVGDRAREGLWAQLGLPTKRDQERTLHLLHQIQGRLLDLEEKLDQTRPEQPGNRLETGE